MLKKVAYEGQLFSTNKSYLNAIKKSRPSKNGLIFFGHVNLV